MKRTIFSFVVLFVLISFTSCSERDLFSGKVLSIPDGMLSFGNVTLGGEKTVQMLITNESGGTIDITEIRFVGDDARDFNIAAPSKMPTELDPIVISGNGAQLGFYVKLKPSKEGLIDVKVEIYFNDDDMVEVEVLANVVQAFIEYSTLRKQFSTLAVGEEETKEVVIMNNSNSTLNITNMFLSDNEAGDFAIIAPSTMPSTLLPISIPAHGSYSMVFKFSPTSPRERTAYVHIVSNSNGNEEFRDFIQLVGFGLDTVPLMYLEVTEHDFGQLRIGNSKTAEFYVYNWSTLALNVTNIEVESPFEIVGIEDKYENVIDFSTPPYDVDGYNIPSKDYLLIIVEFEPTTVGPVLYDIEIESDNGGTPGTIDTIELSGLGSDGQNPIAYASENPVDFGNDLVLTQYYYKYVNIYNHGSGLLIFDENPVVSQSTPLGELFVYDYYYPQSGGTAYAPVVVFPGDYVRIRLRYRPTTAGNMNGKIEFSSNTTGTPNTVTELDVTGTAN
ncbi:MAG: choice-of-anchor D domain-containing protein [Planctomycetes bacterium]|nr:choice-of-anchor D domain-containing protein [Planctomycetota bacterium]